MTTLLLYDGLVNACLFYESVSYSRFDRATSFFENAIEDGAITVELGAALIKDY
ncbi:hypothetical protein CKA32_004374 [Geitlerinema sp. FC II]|uniref:hypothetical protein n=1 Tax=Baaleninema simplex TaxID=2862350 RepID=UPI00034DB308|nr:hypothetical protein [Baaleninema simplex]MDC0833650.1 hypothetical protein [Geitlerinema sp. CS-897]PPT09863.1 hypothetical protein CKA32_004374 [Geitlerinema sp. FC II]